MLTTGTRRNTHLQNFLLSKNEMYVHVFFHLCHIRHDVYLKSDLSSHMTYHICNNILVYPIYVMTCDLNSHTPHDVLHLHYIGHERYLIVHT